MSGVERAAEGALGAVATAAQSVMESIPSTAGACKHVPLGPPPFPPAKHCTGCPAEHAISKHIEEEGDMNVETGEPLPRDAGERALALRDAEMLVAQPTACPLPSAGKAHAAKPADPIMQHTVQAKAEWLDTPHPPDASAHEMALPPSRLKTANGQHRVPSPAAAHAAASNLVPACLPARPADMAYSGSGGQ